MGNNCPSFTLPSVSNYCKIAVAKVVLVAYEG